MEGSLKKGECRSGVKNSDGTVLFIKQGLKEASL